MKLFVKKTISGLIPCSRSDFELLQESKLKIGEIYEVDVKRPRNIKFHRKFFALVNIYFENQSRFQDIKNARAFLTVKAGHCTVLETELGIVKIPDSISFAKMDEIEFSSFYNRFLDAVVEELGGNEDDKQAIIEEISHYF